MASAQQAMGAGLFLMAVHEAFNAYGALNSSPWTAENFGADPEKAASCRRYVLKATGANVVLGIGSWMVSGSAAPFLGICGVSAWMYWEYEKALKKGAVAGTTGWAKC